MKKARRLTGIEIPSRSSLGKALQEPAIYYSSEVFPIFLSEILALITKQPNHAIGS
jgi:hypothetical protein